MLLARGSVASVVLPGDVAGTVVLGHDALKEFLAHPDVAKGAQHFTELAEGRIPDGWPLRTFATVQGMTTADGDDHRRLRSLVGNVFTARRVAELRPRIETVTAELLEGVGRAAAEGDGTVDLRSRFALPLPMGVICELLGVEAEHQDRLHHLSGRVVATDTGPEEAMAANRELVALLGAVAAARAERPGDDLTSALIAARDEGGGQARTARTHRHPAPADHRGARDHAEPHHQRRTGAVRPPRAAQARHLRPGELGGRGGGDAALGQPGQLLPVPVSHPGPHPRRHRHTAGHPRAHAATPPPGGTRPRTDPTPTGST